MSDGPWIKFYPSDWLTGTRGMSPAESGVYITLIAMMYEKGGELTSDHLKLARLCNCPLKPFEKILDRLIDDGKLDRLDDGKLTNKRAKAELATRQKTSIAASQSAAKRWEKDQQNQPSADATAMREASIAGAGQNPDIRSQKESSQTINERVSPSVGAPKAAPAKKATRLSADWVLPKSWGEWALQRGLPRDRVLAEAEKMRNWSMSAPRGAMKDWFPAWKNWVQRAIESGPRARGSAGLRPKSGLAAVMDEFKLELERDGYGNESEKGSDLADDGRLPLIAGPHNQ